MYQQTLKTGIVKVYNLKSTINNYPYYTYSFRTLLV